ncbi:hypothetical protein HBA54_00580 [Pelagibius litoralis]|uniref:Uncharacterized protein n=1 Tax=Pelagibius litoralis TaxID=374515 RepID=A0A967C1H2_9PROT|nr:hypothetical protein [Pelagibius litoralis]NIA67081.1 hypothetical protein [Pelagibius litoralis]
MTHQSQDRIERTPAGSNATTNKGPEGIEFTLDHMRIEQHVIEGRRLRAEATAAFFKALFGLFFGARNKAGRAKAAPQATGNQALQV